MVYLGPSRGCETCKRRRKKCDETRPSCIRCLSSNRTCGGYNDKANIIFRPQEVQDESSAPAKSIARKCSLPVRMPCPNTGILPEDRRPKEFSEAEVEKFALQAFFYDYCITSTNHTISRGYLDGLESLMLQLGVDSDLARACKAVAYASHGIKLDRPRLIKEGEKVYQDLLGNLARSIEKPGFTDTTESLMIAMLLGLYEMIVAGEDHPGNHNAHAKGVAAILKIDNSALDLFGAVHFIQSGHPLFLNGVLQNFGLFSAPHRFNNSQSLDTLLLAFGPIWRKASELMSNSAAPSTDVSLLKTKAMSLNRNFAHWQSSQPKLFNPRQLSHIPSSTFHSPPAAGCWPGRVDIYFDHYVAGVWNTSRMARLLLINLILKLSQILCDGDDNVREHNDASHLIEDMIASIPYHLTDDLAAFVDAKENSDVRRELKPGRAVGGLLLMHPIFIASKLLTVMPSMRGYLQECLSWIAANMGIGQAARFAKATDIDKQYFADGCMLVWTGILV